MDDMKSIAAFFAGAIVMAVLFYAYTGGLEECSKNEYPNDSAVQAKHLCSVKPLAYDPDR